MNSVVKKRIFGYTSLFFLILTCVSVGILYYNDRNLIRNREKISFQTADQDTLRGYYYPGTINAGILLLEGFGADQVMLKGIAQEFYNLGLHVFTFDYSGHGKSQGTIGFDNAQTDTLALQVLAARAQFSAISGLVGSEIILMGHSLGSRVAIESTVMDGNIAGLILLGTQINLDTNTQSEFFTGVSDADLAWVQNLNGLNPATDILLISGAWDDILTPTAAELLYDKLTESPSSSYQRDIVIFDYMLHNYEVYSPRAISYAMNWVNILLGLGFGDLKASTMVLRKTLWSVGVPSLFAMLVLFNNFLKLHKNPREDEEKPNIPIKIVNPKKFLSGKLVLWLLSLPICVIVAGVLSVIPIGVPVFNMIYVGFIAGYGLFMLILYQFRKKKLIPGVEGNFSLRRKSDVSISRILLGLGTTLVIIILVTLFANSGIYGLFPLNVRLIWLVLYGVVTIPAYYISSLEQEWIANLEQRNSQVVSSFHTLIGYIPFILMAILYLALGSLSGLTGAIHGLIIIALVTILGNLVKQFSGSLLFVSIIQSFVLYYLVLPQTALFAFF